MRLLLNDGNEYDLARGMIVSEEKKTREHSVDIVDLKPCYLLVDGVPVQSGGLYNLTVRYLQEENDLNSTIARLRWKNIAIKGIYGDAQTSVYRFEEGQRFELMGLYDGDDPTDKSSLKASCVVTRAGFNGIMFTCDRCVVTDRDGTLTREFRVGPLKS